MDSYFRREHHTADAYGPCHHYTHHRVTAVGEGRFAEPYDPIPDLIDRAEHRRDGVEQLKQIARIAFGAHRTVLGWATDGVTRDPATGDLMYTASNFCVCGSGAVPCSQRRQLTAVLGIEEEER